MPVCPSNNTKCYAYYALHASKEGIYRGYELEKTFRLNIKNSYIFLKNGDKIGAFLGSNQTIGILLLEFDSRKEMDTFFDSPERYVSLYIE